MTAIGTMKVISTITTTLLLTALAIAFLEYCGPTEPEPWGFDVELFTEFVGACQVRLRATVSDTMNIKDIVLERNEEEILRTQLAGSDTMLIDDSALPATSYNYRLHLEQKGKIVQSSEPVSVETLDTTSHDVEWTVHKLGIYGSYMRDVFIISEDDIWAVGFIQDHDSAGNYITYNAMHWDGTEWQPQRIETFYNNRIIFENTNSCVYAFSRDDIWVADYPKHYDGVSWQLFHLHDMGIDAYPIKRCWGTSSDNIYFVGNNGFCIRYDGANWNSIPTGTSLRITDIWGVAEDHIFMVGGDESTGENVFIDSKHGSNKTFEFDSRRKSGVFVTAPNDVYLVCAGLFYYNGYDVSEIPWPDYIPKNYLESVHGNGSNDLFAAGHLQIIIHYNGKSWYSYFESNPATVYYDIKVKNDLIVAVGTNGPQAVMMIGRRK